MDINSCCAYVRYDHLRYTTLELFFLEMGADLYISDRNSKCSDHYIQHFQAKKSVSSNNTRAHGYDHLLSHNDNNNFFEMQIQLHLHT